MENDLATRIENIKQQLLELKTSQPLSSDNSTVFINKDTVLATIHPADSTYLDPFVYIYITYSTQTQLPLVDFNFKIFENDQEVTSLTPTKTYLSPYTGSPGADIRYASQRCDYQINSTGSNAVNIYQYAEDNATKISAIELYVRSLDAYKSSTTSLSIEVEARANVEGLLKYSVVEYPAQ